MELKYEDLNIICTPLACFTAFLPFPAVISPPRIWVVLRATTGIVAVVNILICFPIHIFRTHIHRVFRMRICDWVFPYLCRSRIPLQYAISHISPRALLRARRHQPSVQHPRVWHCAYGPCMRYHISSIVLSKGNTNHRVIFPTSNPSPQHSFFRSPPRFLYTTYFCPAASRAYGPSLLLRGWNLSSRDVGCLLQLRSSGRPTAGCIDAVGDLATW